MHDRECVVCGKHFHAKRSDAKTCSPACRKAKSERARDPQIGSPERRQRQREGLDTKYAYRQRGQARNELQRVGLAPTHWLGVGFDAEKLLYSSDNNDSGPSPQFDNTPPDPIIWNRPGSTARSWHPADGWWRTETRLAVNSSKYIWREYVGSACRYLLEIRAANDPDPVEQASILLRALEPHIRRRLSLANSNPPAIINETECGLQEVVYRYARIMGFTETFRSACDDAEFRAFLQQQGFATYTCQECGPHRVCGDPLRLTRVFRIARHLLSVSEHTRIGEQEMIASDERIAHDAQRLEQISQRLATNMAEVSEIAKRLRERFPRDEEVQVAVDLFLAKIQGA